jgi:hypothetical protein
MSVALKLVHARKFIEQVDVDVDNAAKELHSLHSALGFLSPWKPSIARYVVDRFSEKGQVVLDPFCSAGASGLECALMGRTFLGSTTDVPLARLAAARLAPADLAEVALRVQLVNLKRPVDVRSFTHPFPLFFDVDTFCELVNLKAALRPSADRVDAFVLFIVASVLHGHTVAHLSGYTSPQAALSADQQAELNRKRGEVPSYRAVVPRILRKAATLLRDGVPSALGRDNTASIRIANPRNLGHVTTGRADLALLCPEQPGFMEHGINSWLRTWWLGAGSTNVQGNPETLTGFAWREYGSEVLLETARAVRRGGRAVVRVGSGRVGTRIVNYKDELSAVLQEGLNGFWSIEGTVIERHVKSSGLAKGRDGTPRDTAGELVVLRRK